MGYLVTIEAPDASGKATQTKMLCERLRADGYRTEKFSFPNYGSGACKPVEMYLAGFLGSKPEDTNAYAASTFFAVDRYFSYRKDWKSLYESKDCIIVLDRYTTSNAVHQICKKPKEEWDGFLDWLYDFEFVKLGLPVPDLTLSLDVLPETSEKLMKRRAVQENRPADIHEADREYLVKCHEAAEYAAEKWSWEKIYCCERDGEMKSREQIHSLIYQKVLDFMPKEMKK